MLRCPAHQGFLSTPSARRATPAWERQKQPRYLFLSTPSARRATSERIPRKQAVNYFYPRPPRGGRRTVPSLALMILLFLSTPSARRATHSFQCGHPAFQFLSTPSARRATSRGRGSGSGRKISIHALREEGDYAMIWQEWFRDQFLSTPSARRATTKKAAQRFEEKFLSTPSARRATPRMPYGFSCRCYFYPRPPRGGRRHQVDHVRHIGVISIHALREEGDSCNGGSGLLR